MADHKRIARYLNLILKSQCFSRSSVNKELLRYLIDATIRGENPKEFQIANEVFGKTAGSKDKDFNIRVYILNLRKKLKEYYEREGKNDEIKFEIPKGKYIIQIKTDYRKIYSKKIYKIAPVLLTVSILLFAGTFFLYQHRKSPEAARHSFWHELTNKNYPVLLIIGDHYFFMLNNTNEISGTMRVNRINSDKDLDQYLTKKPELINRIEKTDQKYINFQAPFGIYRVMNILGGGLTDINMIYSSKLRWKDLKNKHVIFIGSYKTQNILQQVNEKLGINYDIAHSTINYSFKDSLIQFKNHKQDNLLYEYATLVHLTAKDGRRIIFFMSNRDVGNIATLKLLTEKKGLLLLDNATKKTGSTSYKAVFEVKGVDETDFKTKLLRIDTIDIPVSEVLP